MDNRVALPKHGEVVISDELAAELEKLTPSTSAREVPLEKQAAILKYWPIKNKEELAKALGMSTTYMRRIYKSLTANE